MSCSLIEAKFQVLDRTIKMLSKSKSLRTPRVASSEQLRELVETQKPTSLLPTINPVRGVVVTRSKQANPSIDRASRSQPNTAREQKSERRLPPRPSTGRRESYEDSTARLPDKWVDPKQKRVEQLLQDTYHEIGSAVNWGRNANPEAPLSKLLSGSLRDERHEQDSMSCEEDHHDNNQACNDPETFNAAVHNALPPPKRPLTSYGLQPKKSKAYLSTRCRSASFMRSDPQPKNWFAPSAVGTAETSLRPPKAKRKNCRQRPVTDIEKQTKQHQMDVKPPSPPRPEEVEPTRRPVALEVTGESEGKCPPPVSIPTLAPQDDPSFYMLELRLVHPEPLTDWRFQATFTDTSVTPSRTVILDDLAADDDNCLVFDNSQSAPGPVSSRYFNPFLYFPGLRRPSDLYGHVLSIIVTSLQPVTRTVINTSVQFTRFPDEAPVQSTRQHSEAVAAQETSLLRVRPQRNRSASSASRRKPNLRKKQTPRPPPQTSSTNNHDVSTTSLAMDQCSPWSSGDQGGADIDAQSSVVETVAALQLDEPRSPSPTASPRTSQTTEHMGTSPRLPMTTIDKKKMQLQRLRANIRKEMTQIGKVEARTTECVAVSSSRTARKPQAPPRRRRPHAPSVSQANPVASAWEFPVLKPRDPKQMEGQVVELTEAEQAQHQLQMEQQLKSFWAKQLLEMEQLEVGSEQDFKNHNDLPLARIKRIMKSDEDVRMISAEAPVLFAKACEMFILELTLRSWGYSEKNKRRTLQKEDIQTAIRNTDIFDFLVDVIN
ncbi:hypothetical protein PHYPSEUDO_013990 [Phytophthora pseudosyringae]|nr:hypothetical protein PHYPSEUDO_013990 [Phytophthora pseudosyringae]